jgi:hypothetical protein
MLIKTGIFVGLFYIYDTMHDAKLKLFCLYYPFTSKYQIAEHVTNVPTNIWLNNVMLFLFLLPLFMPSNIYTQCNTSLKHKQ